MTNRVILSATLFLAACGSNTSDQSSLPQGKDKQASNASSKPVKNVSLAEVGLDPSALNKSVSPCDDFYEYACGGWLANTEIPADKARYGRFTQIYERNEAALHAILEEAQSGSLQSPVAAKIGSYYGACMDEAAVEKNGVKAIAPLMAAVRSVKNVRTLDSALATLHKRALPVVFNLNATPDFKDATLMIGEMSHGGLGLPDRDYYLKDDDTSVELRKTYEEHVANMLVLGGMKKAAAAVAAKDVLAIETELAKVSMARADRRDPEKVYHKIDREGVESLVPGLDWTGYFTTLGIPEIKDINVDHPDFFARVGALREEMKPAQWRNYLTWHVLHKTAALLPAAFVEEDFKLSQAISGAKELPPRWKRCVSSTDHALGELLAQPYLKRMFTPEAKDAVDQMVVGITSAFGTVVNDLDWMSEATKEKALAKLGTMSPMFGYPDSWKSYEWTVNPDNHTANALMSSEFEYARDLAKIGLPYDRSEWFMSPPTTNAYYNPQANQMVFPAGILQPPFFDKDAHVPVNLGAMGMIVGHELTHGFDDQGAKFDGAGNMNGWWADVDLKQFEERGECISNQYAQYEAVEGVNLNGQLTLGENIADNGGIKLALMAYREMVKDADAQLVADGFNEDQQFFLAVGQAWCSKSRDEIARMLAVTDPHSPPKFRVIGSLSNSEEFAEAFSCDKGTPMNPEKQLLGLVTAPHAAGGPG